MSERPDRRLHHFAMLNAAERRESIVKLARSGMSELGIASATRLAVEQIRKVLGEERAREEAA